MVKAIVGKNAVGKTMYIKHEYINLVNNGKIVSTNLCSSDEPDTVIDVDICSRINLVAEVLQLKIVEGSKTVVFDYSEVSDVFANLVRLIAHKVDCVILDDPEMGLEDYEISALAGILACCDNLHITTHSDILALQFEDDLYNVVNGELVKVNNEDTDCI